jgi:hypothetical protein
LKINGKPHQYSRNSRRQQKKRAREKKTLGAKRRKEDFGKMKAKETTEKKDKK